MLVGAVGLAGWFVFERNNQPKSLTVATEAKPKKVVAVGDIVCDPSSDNANSANPEYCQSDQVYNLVSSLRPDAVLGLGDLQYDDGALNKFQAAFDKKWGDLQDIFYPAPGNHEYGTPNAAGYFSYFANSKLKDTISEPYYSFNLGGWHLISLNSNCEYVGGCDEGSPQLEWLRTNLEKAGNKCTLAFWHHPHFTSGKYSTNQGSKSLSSDMWAELFGHQADIVLNGHDHLYERFKPQDPDGLANPDGIRQFTVGTGGKEHYSQQTTADNSEKVIDDKFGVLTLELYPDSYKWQFKSVGGEVQDSGSQACI